MLYLERAALVVQVVVVPGGIPPLVQMVPRTLVVGAVVAVTELEVLADRAWLSCVTPERQNKLWSVAARRQQWAATQSGLLTAVVASGPLPVAPSI